MRLCSNTKHLGHLSKITASPHAIFALWPDPTARVHGPPPVPWRAWTQKDARMHQIYPKGDFRSLLNDELSICCTNITNIVLLVEQPLVQRVLVHFPRVFETAPWLEIENTSQNLEWCMGSKNLAIINPIKCLSPQDDSEFSLFFTHTYHPYLSHFVTIYPHLIARNISDPNPLCFHRAGAS